MGPLVPDIISNNLNLIVALVIGILFGAILEQAGFRPQKNLSDYFMDMILRYCGFFLRLALLP